ncbi:MAG: TRAP transporter large permease subunit [Burkholderiaceae bacterium]|nr:MAG: TRAP transporter large permease subunit [Burkholderiaceae bacterium]
MPWYETLLLLSSLLIFLILLGLWIPVAIPIAGLLILVLIGEPLNVSIFAIVGFNAANSFVLTAIPMFVLMGELLIQGKIIERFYRAALHWLDWLPGQLLHTNILACAIMAAISGSSVATAGTIGAVAVPNMKKLGYPLALTHGTIAAGGTLGILIPPSILMIIYGAVTQTSIAKLFAGGVLPGVLASVLFMAYIFAYALIYRKRMPIAQPAGPRGEKRSALRTAADVLPVIILILGVLGAIYMGLATPSEAGAIGTLLAVLIVASAGELSLARIWISLTTTTRISAMLVFIIAGAQITTYVLVKTGISSGLANYVTGLGLSEGILIIAIGFTYFVLGMFIDGPSIIYLTIPLLLPILQGYQFNLIVFGIIATILCEFALITPPMGLNLFVLKAIDRETPIGTIVKGIIPFLLILVGIIAIIYYQPSLVLWLANRVGASPA